MDNVVGSPEVTAPAPKEAEPELEAAQEKELKLGGKTFKVNPELHEAIEGYRREINERDGRRGSELQTLRQTVEQLRTAVEQSRKPDAKPVDEGPRPPDPTLAFTDPGRYQTELLQFVESRVAQREAALIQRYETDKQAASDQSVRQKVWDQRLTKFYQDNPDLQGEEDLVTMVWQKNFNDLKDMSLDDGFAKLADLSRSRILKAAGRVKDADKSGPVKLEGSRPRSAPAAPRGEQPGSLSDLIRNRQRRMREGKPVEG